MADVVIIVKNGMVETVLSSSQEEISVDVIDMDTQDPNELEELEEQKRRICEDKAYREIY